jgi:hypothetical protein
VSTLTFGMDIEVERKGILARFSELIAAGREVHPTLVFYKLNERVLAVTLPPAGDEVGFLKNLQHALFLFPALQATSAMVGLHSEVLLTNNTMNPAVVTVALSKTGADSEAHPYELTDEGVSFLEDAKLSPDSKMYSDLVDHMFPIFATANRFPFRTSEVLEFLADGQHDIEFFGDHKYSNIDT